jgi:toxin secretion/phage lysis holin
MEKHNRTALAFAVAVFVISIFTFVAGFAAGSTALATKGLLLDMCSKIFTQWVTLAVGAYLAAAVLDVCTGLIKAFSKGNFQSSEMRKGIWKKVATIGMICVTCILSTILFILGLKISTWIIIAVCAWFGIMEIGSNFENAQECGVPIPGFIKRYLKVAQDQIESTVEELTPAPKEESTTPTSTEVDNK